MVQSSFQHIIQRLEDFWSQQNCLVLQPYDTEMGAATSSPYTALYALGPNPWNVAFVQPCRRPGDGRYGDNPNRLQKFHQLQVFLKPIPENIQDLLIASYEAIGINTRAHDIRFVEDNWENPSLGASGVGWEVWLDGMEITQYTYFQQVGGISCTVPSVELAYGLERVALCLQKKSNTFDIHWNDPINENSAITSYGVLTKRAEKEFCAWYFEYSPIQGLRAHFEDHLEWGNMLIKKNCVLPAYHQCIQANHLFNMLDARGAISVSQRAHEISRMRHLAQLCCQQWLES